MLCHMYALETKSNVRTILTFSVIIATFANIYTNLIIRELRLFAEFVDQLILILMIEIIVESVVCNYKAIANYSHLL